MEFCVEFRTNAKTERRYYPSAAIALKRALELDKLYSAEGSPFVLRRDGPGWRPLTEAEVEQAVSLVFPLPARGE